MTVLEENAAAHKLPATDPAAGKIVLVHGGARDAYQVALALDQTGLLDALVTDMYWDDKSLLARSLPRALAAALRVRTAPGLNCRHVQTRLWSGLLATGMERMRFLPLDWRRAARRLSDGQLGRAAGSRARARREGLLSYSYFGSQAFKAYGRPAMLFQVHPHPQTMRTLLTDELRLNPQCAESLQQEWELALPEADFLNLVEEASVATHYLVASSFTRNSLVEHGVSAAAISVVPYGIDLQRFTPSPEQKNSGPTLHLLFVGRINQRKGLSYLLEALRLLPEVDLHLTICGRVVDDLSIFREFADRITIRPSVSAEELVLAYQSADLFVFPSVAEGFGQVLLEALACGLPILSTTHTAAPDLVDDGVQGFIVEPRRPDQLAEAIVWARDHREELRTMGRRARARAEEFTWARFRAGVNQAVVEYLRAEKEAGDA